MLLRYSLSNTSHTLQYEYAKYIHSACHCQKIIKHYCTHYCTRYIMYAFKHLPSYLFHPASCLYAKLQTLTPGCSFILNTPFLIFSFIKKKHTFQNVETILQEKGGQKMTQKSALRSIFSLYWAVVFGLDRLKICLSRVTFQTSCL